MTDTVLLYVVFGVMLAAAIAAILPTFLRGVHSGDEQEDEHAAFLQKSLREEAERLEAEFAQGLHTEEAYRSLREDLERRAVEEMRETETTKSRVAPVSLRNAVIGVVALMVCVPVMCYQLLGAPEVMLLVKDQQVFQGEARDVEQIREYLKVNEKDARAWVLLARRHVDEENFPKAAEAYRRGRAANAKVKADPAVMLELAATLLTIGGPDSMREAQPLAQGAVEGRPGDMKAVEILTVAASANEDWRTAAESLSLLMSTMNPDTPEYVQYEMTLKRLRELAASQKTPLPSTSR